MSQTPTITIGEREANDQLYCKAMKMLTAEQRSLKKNSAHGLLGPARHPAPLPASPEQSGAGHEGALPSALPMREL
jgi:hypothetical protein